MKNTLKNLFVPAFLFAAVFLFLLADAPGPSTLYFVRLDSPYASTPYLSGDIPVSGVMYSLANGASEGLYYKSEWKTNWNVTGITIRALFVTNNVTNLSVTTNVEASGTNYTVTTNLVYLAITNEVHASGTGSDFQATVPGRTDPGIVSVILLFTGVSDSGTTNCYYLDGLSDSPVFPYKSN